MSVCVFVFVSASRCSCAGFSVCKFILQICTKHIYPFLTPLNSLDFAEKESRLEEEKLRFESQLRTAEEEVFALRSALAVSQTQAMEMKAVTDRLTAAKGDEYELVLAEVERANERAIVAEGKVGVLEEKMKEIVAKKAEAEGG